MAELSSKTKGRNTQDFYLVKRSYVKSENICAVNCWPWLIVINGWPWRPLKIKHMYYCFMTCTARINQLGHYKIWSWVSLGPKMVKVTRFGKLLS